MGKKRLEVKIAMDDRLTNRNANGGIVVRDLPAALEKLAALEDMKEHGRLLELPCPLGERVYEVQGKAWSRDCRDKPFSYFPECQYPSWKNDGKDCPCAERTVINHCKVCEYYRAGAERYCERPYDENAQFNIRAKLFTYVDIPNVGETVFLTAKEAEAALQEREART